MNSDHDLHHSEASEDDEVHHLELDEEEPSGEDLQADAHRDYEEIPELDEYDAADMDDAEQPALTAAERERAEQMMELRDQRRQAQAQMGGARYGHFFQQQEDSMEVELNDQLQRLRVGEAREEEAPSLLDEAEGEPVVGGGAPLAGGELLLEHLGDPRVQRQVKKRFQAFLEHTFEGAGEGERVQVYVELLRAAMQENWKSVAVEFEHLSKYDSELTQWVLEHPKQVLPLLDEVAYATALSINPGFELIHRQMFVRIRKIAIEDKFRELRINLLNSMVRVRGVVTKRTAILARLWKASYRCLKCGMRKGPLVLTGGDDLRAAPAPDVGLCALCQAPGPWALDEAHTLYSNYQRLVIQEPPQEVPAGRMPRHKTVVLTNDLVDGAKPGDQVIVTGAYLSQYSAGSHAAAGTPLFDTFIEANHVERVGELGDPDCDCGEVSGADRERFRKFVFAERGTQHFEKLRAAVAPSLHGLEREKTAVLLSMAAGCSKALAGGLRLRGDINVLLLGDPGLGKSQLLKWASQVFPRAVLTSGKGASAVGLTAGVHRDVVTREWTLEGGAMVLADKGLCLIDEFDKMNDQDRVSIHEAMEQQTISISKAGIVSTLQARCAVIAGANPVKGEYDDSLSFADNVNLSEPILSRFDLLCVMRDAVDRHTDRTLAAFIMRSHLRALQACDDGDDDEEDLTNASEVYDAAGGLRQAFLRKYVSYARTLEPQLDADLSQRLTKFYTKIRKVSDHFGGIKITPRHLESVIRMSEARAKLSLRRQVTHADVEFAQDMMLYTFIKSQKRSLQTNLVSRLGAFMLHSASAAGAADNTATFLHTLSLMAQDKLDFSHAMLGGRPQVLKLSLRQFEEKVAHLGLPAVAAFLRSPEFRQKYDLNAEARVIYVREEDN